MASQMVLVKRGRGRPAGSKNRLIAHDRVLGVHHFAFLRSWLLGLDLRWAWDRYIAFSEASNDVRHMEHRRKELLAAALHQGHQLNLSLPADQRITHVLNILSREPVIAPSKVLPTLDEFMAQQGIDPDLYSEAELIELYTDHYGETGEGPLDENSGEHVKALNQLAMLIAIPPSPTDPLTRWLVPSLVQRLRAVGAVSIQDLVNLVNVYGYRWYKKVERLGETQARHIVQWLQSIEEHTNLAVRETALTSPAPQTAARALALRHIEIPPSFAIVPLDRLAVPSSLVGSSGMFRTNMPNTLGANDDQEAIHHWLRKYEERPATYKAYRREVERFYLWCLHEAKKPLSSIDSMDCLGFRKFLQAIPAHWIQPKAGPGRDLDWKPFRGQLSPVSQKRALVVVQVMFEGLRKAGYLVANPMADVFTNFNLPESKIDANGRSFTNLEWDFVMRQADALPPSPTRTRLLLMLELLVGLGLRLDELATARMSKLERVLVDDDPEPAWVLTVIGKRRKQREVLMPDHVYELLTQHHQEMGEWMPLSEQSEPLALVLTCGQVVPKWVATEGSPSPTLVRDSESVGLSKEGIYATLKRFFKRLAKEAADNGLDARRFENASTHWMRHTFGRQAVQDEVPLDVIQQALGHASISTTTIYTTSERSRMIRQLRRKRT